MVRKEAYSAQIPIVIMGVSGAGKTTLGAEIARRLARPFIDADHLHPRENRAKMEAGVALDDADREPWLQIVGEAITRGVESGEAPIVACSALKLSYREMLRNSYSEITFLYLDASRDLLAKRLSERQHEYMPASLLPSQLETLEPPAEAEFAIRLEVEGSIDEMATKAIAHINRADLRDREEA